MDCNIHGTYSFAQVVVAVDSRRVVGFAEGDDAVQVVRDTQLGTPVVGADGASIVAFTADQSARVILKLLPNSPFNKFFEQKVKRQRTGIGAPFALSIADSSTGETGGCTTAHIIKEPDKTKGAKPTEYEWEIFCPCWQNGEITYYS